MPARTLLGFSRVRAPRCSGRISPLPSRPHPAELLPVYRPASSLSLAVLVEGIEPLHGFGRREDQLVGAEELHEQRPVFAHLLPALLDSFRVAEH